MKSPLNILYIGKAPDYFEQIGAQENCALTILDNNVRAVNYLKAEQHRPDAIICDYHLSGQNGLFLFDWIRQRTAFNSTPFILAAHEFSADIFKQAYTKKVDDFYVTTTTPPSAFIERIKFLCSVKASKSEASVEDNTTAAYRMPVSKRIFDILVASTVLLMVSPLLLLVIIAIRLESKGKVYYIAKRVGRKTFDFYKLRSMRTGSDDLLKKLAKEKNQYNKAPGQNSVVNQSCPRCAKLPEGDYCSPVMYVDTHQVCDYWHNYQKKEIEKSSAAFVKIVDDPRVTRVGKFIRNTSIDELPQLINVIKGDMSIVGNRPLPVYEAELLTGDNLSKRFLAPAGITGLWQVELRGKGGNMSEEERMRLDNEYADHFEGDRFSFWYDIKLILRTIPALLQKGAV